MWSSSSLAKSNKSSAPTPNKSLLLILIFVFAVISKAQDGNGVVAILDGQSITQQQVDETVISQIFPLQQQLFAIRKTALENLIIRRLLENEAARRKVTIDNLKRQ